MLASLTFAPWFAHGLAVDIKDVPLPLGVFYIGAAAALVISFVILLFGVRSAHFGTVSERRAPGWLDRLSRARASSIVLKALALAWLITVVTTTMFGGLEGGENPGPNLVFVLGWLGLPVAALVLGRGALELHPVAALARAGGMRDNPAPGAPGGDPGATADRFGSSWGVWVAWAGLLLFTWLELVYPTSTKVRFLGALILLWTVVGLAIASTRGVRAYRERLDPIGTYVRMLAALAPWERGADGTLRVRAPLLGANRDIAPTRGLVALVTLLIGSVSYDGLTRTTWWQERVALATADLTRSGVDAANGRMLFGTFAFVMLISVAWSAFELAAWSAGRIGRLDVGRGPRRAAQLFAPSLLPIALAYVVAHYFSFLVVQCQDLIRLASDPFDHASNWFGTANRLPRDLWRPSGTVVWFVQVGSIVIGHIAGLLLAHDRALELAPKHVDGRPDIGAATRSQLPMLALMVLYTVGGLYFLSEGLS